MAKYPEVRRDQFFPLRMPSLPRPTAGTRTQTRHMPLSPMQTQNHDAQEPSEQKVETVGVTK
jgi:hypothetical protein